MRRWLRRSGRFTYPRAASFSSAAVLLVLTFTVAACGAAQGGSQPSTSLSVTTGGQGTTTTTSGTTTTTSGTTTTTAGTTTSPSTGTSVRIGVMIPAFIFYQGLVYTGSGRALATASAVPSDLALLGSAAAARDRSGGTITGSSYEVYAIKGVSPDTAIAVKFPAVSNDGPVWEWLEYQRK